MNCVYVPARRLQRIGFLQSQDPTMLIYKTSTIRHATKQNAVARKSGKPRRQQLAGLHMGYIQRELVDLELRISSKNH